MTDILNQKETPTVKNTATETINTNTIQQQTTEIELLNKEVITFSELRKYRVTDVPFLWGNIIPKYGITFLTGPSDCNKSTFLRQLAFAIGRGDTEFLDLPLLTAYKSVIMVITEDLAVNILPLINKQLDGQEEDESNIDIRFVFPTSDVHKKLKQLLSEQKADLVIIDTWTDTFQKDLNQANDVRASLQKLNELIQQYGCGMLCLHHIKKGADEKAPSKDGMIGSMGIQAYARTVIEMRRESAHSANRLLTVVKGNYTADESKDHSLVLKLDTDTMLLSNTNSNLLRIGGQPKSESRNFTSEQKETFMVRIRELLGEGISQDSIVGKLKEENPSTHTPSKGTIHKWLKEDETENKEDEK